MTCPDSKPHPPSDPASYLGWLWCAKLLRFVMEDDCDDCERSN
jgi:hypothetical protein